MPTTLQISEEKTWVTRIYHFGWDFSGQHAPGVRWLEFFAKSKPYAKLHKVFSLNKLFLESTSKTNLVGIPAELKVLLFWMLLLMSLRVLLVQVLYRVDTRVSFVRTSREFHAKQVSYFAKKCSLFREISCFAKLALACEGQFRMFRISRNKTFNKRNEAKLQRRIKKHCSFQIKIVVDLFN